MRLNEFIREADDQHRQAMRDTGFWGRAGAGCIIMARSTGRILLPFRSAFVLEPHTWGVWGGAIDPGEDPVQAVQREVHEETGIPPNAIDTRPLYVFEKGEFKYFNFLAMIDEEVEPKLDWETERGEWFEFGNWPSPLHYGLQALLNDPSSNQLIQAYAQKYS